MDLQSNDLDVLTTLVSTEPVADPSTSEPEEVGENAAAATFGAAVVTAEAAMQQVCEWAGKNLTRSELRVSAAFDAVMPDVYAAISAIEESGDREKFLAAKGVKTHGNVRNAVSPVLKALAQTEHKHVRSWLSKYSCLLALGLAEKIPPSEFLVWRKATTLEDACKKWRDLERGKDGQKQETAGTSAFQKLQSAWKCASDDDKAKFLTENNLLRVE